MKSIKSERLGSLDILRGFDLFMLVFFQPILRDFTRAINNPFFNSIYAQFDHVAWEGFVFWDLIMPLFMFMAGVSMPFAFSKYMRGEDKRPLYKRIIKRVILLFVLGMFVQGNILSFDIEKFSWYSNVLQTIAVGYLFSALILLNLSRTWQLITTSGLLLLYWALLSFVEIKGFGAGNYSPDLNLAEYFDRAVLGHFRAKAVLSDSEIVFNSNYRYTWILSNLTFIVTVMTGVFAGQILKGKASKTNKFYYLLVTGIAMIIVGQLGSLHMPIIKKIWTSSMTLYSSGICFILMALFYYLIDLKNYGKYFNWLKIYGMNSIMAYLLFEMINFRCIADSLLYGLEPHMGAYYGVLLAVCNVSIIFAILWFMNKKGWYLKV